MPGAPTPNKGYALPTVFGDPNAWGTELNSNFSLLDLNVGGTVSLGVSGSTASVTGTNLQYGGFKFTGSLSVTNTVTFASYAGFAFISNGTTGSQNLSCGISGGTFVTVQPSETVPVWSDGANFYRLAVIGGGIGTTGTGQVVLASGAALTNPTGVLPPGIMAPYAGTTPPTGGAWLYCDGSPVSRTTYAALFAVCSTSYGSGDGVTTFNLPDMRGRTAFGYDSGNATGRMTGNTGQGISASTIGNIGGEQTHVLNINELATHNHGTSDPSHSHNATNWQGPANNSAVGYLASQDALGNAIQANASSGTNPYVVLPAYTGISINNTGSNFGHNTLPPGLITGYIIKT